MGEGWYNAQCRINPTTSLRATERKAAAQAARPVGRRRDRIDTSPHFSHWSRPASRPGDAIRQEEAEKRSSATVEAL